MVAFHAKKFTQGSTVNALALNSDIRTVRLSGALGRKFGRIHNLAVATPAEALRALCMMIPGFRSEMEKPSNRYRVLIGESPMVNVDNELHMQFGVRKSFTFAPVIRGSKSGLGQIILGAVLVAASFLPGAAFLMNIGVAMLIGGVIQMLTPMPKSTDSNKDENKPNTQFNGAVNTQAQGNAVPLAYGDIMAGSAVVSAGLSSGFLTAGIAVDPVTGNSSGSSGSFTPGAGTGLFPGRAPV